MWQNEDQVNWAVEPEETIICYCGNVSKQQICWAIEDGASTVAAIISLTGAGKGNKCLQLNPKKRCCHPDIEQILKLYSSSFIQQHGVQTCSCK